MDLWILLNGKAAQPAQRRLQGGGDVGTHRPQDGGSYARLLRSHAPVHDGHVHTRRPAAERFPRRERAQGEHGADWHLGGA